MCDGSASFLVLLFFFCPEPIKLRPMITNTSSNRENNTIGRCLGFLNSERKPTILRTIKERNMGLYKRALDVLAKDNVLSSKIS